MYGSGFTETDCGFIVGTDQSQGRGQIISNINACLAVQNTIKTTLGPYGGDLLLVDANGKQTITNDGATVMKASLSLSIALYRCCSADTEVTIATRYCSPCCTYIDGYSEITRCRSWRWNNICCCYCRRDLEGGEGICGGGC